jgi:hypothetical protein
MDSRMMEKVHMFCGRVRLDAGGWEGRREKGAYFDKDEGVLVHGLRFAVPQRHPRAHGEDLVGRQREERRQDEAVHAELPRLLALARAGVDEHHQEDNVQRRANVEQLRGKEVECSVVAERVNGKYVEVARDKDEDVQRLRDETHTLREG